MKPMINLKEPFVLTPQFKEEKKQFLAFGEKKKCLQARADKFFSSYNENIHTNTMKILDNRQIQSN